MVPFAKMFGRMFGNVLEKLELAIEDPIAVALNQNPRTMLVSN